ncbi:MAG: hypothetical protein ACHP84_08565 [Caulobacterales bacterium]
MKTPVIAMMAGAVACALSTPAFALQKIAGTIPPGTTPVVISFKLPATPRKMLFTFIAPRPRVSPGVPYALNYCVGPKVNPCGLPSSHVVNVPEGGKQSASFNSAIFATNILVVGQGTKAPVPFVVEIVP